MQTSNISNSQIIYEITIIRFTNNIHTPYFKKHKTFFLCFPPPHKNDR